MTRDDARRRVEDHATELMERLGTSVTSVVRAWSGDVMSFAFAVRGVRVEGTVHVDETDAILDVEGRSLLEGPQKTGGPFPVARQTSSFTR